uniref:Tetraspanin-9 n=1 Tax=Ailuropoda melanoleuca TaxID=9646 RepID=A0A7N5JWY4_AILME
MESCQLFTPLMFYCPLQNQDAAAALEETHQVLSGCLLELCGCGLLGVGIWLSVSQGNFATFSPSFPSLSAANLVIAIGTIVMVTGFLGCLGAIKENKCLLLSFFIVLLAILLAELILLILFFVYMDKVNENARKDLKEGLLLYNTENNVGLKNAWNIIQAEMHCCGVTDYTDWYPVLGENTVPDRCCMENSQGCGRNTTTPLWRTVRLDAAPRGLFPEASVGDRVARGHLWGGAPGTPRNWLNRRWGGGHTGLKPKGMWTIGGLDPQLGVSEGGG